VVADRFMAELAKSVRRRPDPLPTTFRPLADAIAGRRPVMLSTDAASRRALRSVGKVAATTGETIHLDAPSVSRSRLNEVIAHELTHIAAPSPAPRFFDDADDTPEERRAERVGKIMARSPLAPSAAVIAPRGRTQPDVVRRSPAPSSSSAPSSGAPTVSAEALAARMTGSSTTSPSRTSSSQSPSNQSSPVVRRRADPAASSATSASAAEPVIRRLLTDQAAAGSSTTSAESERFEVPLGTQLQRDDSAAAWFEDQLNEHMSSLLRMIEDRMIIELERRGGRTWRMT